MNLSQIIDASTADHVIGDRFVKEALPLRWFDALIGGGCKVIGRRRMTFEKSGDPILFTLDSAAVRMAPVVARLFHKPPGARKETQVRGSRLAMLAMCWHLDMTMMTEIAAVSTDAGCEIVIFASFEADGGTQAVIANAGEFLRVGLSPEIQVHDFDLENEDPAESFYLLPKPSIFVEDVGDDEIRVSLNRLTDLVDLEEMGSYEWRHGISDWAIDFDHDGKAFEPDFQFFPPMSKGNGWRIVGKKFEISSKVIEEFEGFVSPAFHPGDRLAVQIHDTRGTNHLLDYSVEQKKRPAG